MPKSIKQTADAAGGRSGAPAPLGRLIRIPKTAEVVASHIRKMIIRGELKEGDFLQPEAQLMAQFGTSRPTLREAFRILESEGFISVTRGSRSGARVHLPDVDGVARLAGFALQAQGVTLADIYESRLALEPYAARLAAERRTPQDVERLRALLEEARRLVDQKDWTGFRAATVNWHRTLVEITGNKTLLMMVSMLQEVLEAHQARFAERPPEEQMKSAKLGCRSLELIIELVEAGDGDGAEAHWRRHTENANNTWLMGFGKTTVVDVLD